MLSYVAPALYTVFVWWFSTGIILILNRQPQRMHARSMYAASLVLAVALCGLSVTRNDDSPTGAYLAFTCSVLVWGWQEMAFLMGYITGPREEACPPGALGWKRFVAATQTIIYHEIALAGTLLAVLAITWGSVNQVGIWTFAVLWVMRLSAKLNLFLGVRNRSEDLLPDHLRYLRTFFRQKPVNLLFPFSVTASSVAAAAGWMAVAASTTGSAQFARLSLVVALLSLAILEHWLMVLPLEPSRLWMWATQKRAAPRAAVASTPRPR